MNALRNIAATVLVVILIVILFSIFGAAFAQSPQCDTHDRVIHLLADRYGELLVGRGTAGTEAQLELFAHPDGSTWTAVIVLPDGKACLMASGIGWTTVAGGEDI
jgi:hypothetical protein